MVTVKEYRTFLDVDRLPVLREEVASYEVPSKSFTNPDEILSFAEDILEMSSLAEEYVYCLCLDTKNHLKGFFEVSHGSVTGSIVTPREVFEKALMLEACRIILMHNHPSGDATPSEQDAKVTKAVKDAGEILGVPLLDHMVIGAGTYYSFFQNVSM